MGEILLLLCASFVCSAGFGVGFGIRPKELPIAGLVGVITRIALILAKSAMDNRVAYTMIAALVGGIAAHILSHRLHSTTTKFLYPAYVPIIPGDLLWHAVSAVLSREMVNASSYSAELVQALIGLAIGASVIPLVFNPKQYLKDLKKAKIR